jgi:tetratricopeptide (TPR) repeat protein
MNRQVPYLLRLSQTCLFLMLFIIFGPQCSNPTKPPEVKLKNKYSEADKITQSEPSKDSILFSKSDSLKNLLKNACQDTTRIRILDALATIETNDSIKEVYNLQIEALAQSGLNAYVSDVLRNACLKYISNALFRKGLFYDQQDEYQDALSYYNKCLKIREVLNDKKGMSAIFIPIGNINYFQGNIQKAIDCYEKSLQLSEETNDKIGISRSLNNLGSMYSDQDNIPRALEYFNRSLKIDEEAGNKAGMSSTLNNIGITYSYQGDMANALEYYNRCLTFKEELGNKYEISVALSNIGTIYEYQGDLPLALEFYYRSLKLQEELGDKWVVSGTYTNIGNVYADQAENKSQNERAARDSLYQKSLEFYFKSLKICEESGKESATNETLINIGQTYDEQGDTLKALEYYYKSLAISKKIGDQSSISFALVKIGDIYFGRNNIEPALNCAKQAYRIAKETGYTFNIKDASELLDRIYTKQGNYKLSRQYFGEYITMRDSITKEENQQMVQKKYFQYQYEKKAATDSIAHSKEMEISKLEIEKRKSENRKQKLVIGFVAAGLLLVLMLAGYIFRSLRITRRQKGTIEKQKEHIEYMHEELTASIRYAERIQKALLPTEENIRSIITDSKNAIAEYFILYKPRQIVSGDFYFFERKQETIFIAAADCTGHGVPGAFMSMLGITYLNEIVTHTETEKPSEILNLLRENIIHSLQQKGIEGEQKDGMDISLISLNLLNGTLQFAGANNSLLIIPNGCKELVEIKADPMPAAIYDNMKPFTNHEIRVSKGDKVYLASDGYGDQFGGPNGKKFLSKKFKQLLVEISEMTMSQQKVKLNQIIEDWRNNYAEKFDQIDDITVIGVKMA